ncbi:S9 family peptidase [Aliikangiella sp. G2MR2-5]|uniref:S9 family peptidase n=1 Tax=Aliikangiella sp. G2MR2-5 TaxID=2788943 RepID=UPI001AEE85BA|nr:S9 family peptidase [Aliikangiella sp. G2MR2-5]
MKYKLGNLLIGMGLLIFGFTPFLSAKKLTVERIYSSPSLTGPSMRGLQISPDGSRVTFLKGKETDYERLDLWEYHIPSGQTRMLVNSDDLHSGNENLSDEEKARRERMRLSGTGIVRYRWSKDGTALLFPLAGDIYYYNLQSKKAEKLVSTPEFETDIRFSPKGNYVSFIRDQNLYVYDLRTGTEKQITKEGGGHIRMAMAEFVAQEEMDRMTGYWWSNDESKIAFTKVDESPVEEVTRTEIYADEIKMIKQRYPFAGKNNVEISLAITELKSGKVKWIDLGKNKDFYLPRVKWTEDNNRLTYQWQSRDQKTLKLNRYNWKSEEQITLINEKNKTWINLNNDLYFLKNNQEFIWASEKNGFNHLYLYDNRGRQIRQLTKGKWVVKNIENLDQKNRVVYFTATKDSPLETHLYSVSLDGGKINKITQEEGVHGIVFSDDSQSYIDYFSSPKTPPQISLKDNNGKLIAWLNENKVDANHPLAEYINDFIQPEFGSFKNDKGIELFYRLYKPSGFDENKKYPVLVFLYGGPHAQMVTKSWQSYFLQFMAQNGYVVFTLDNRGSNYRGKAFEDPIYRAMGSVEIDDQVAGVKYLRQFSWVDSEKVGIHGHSYGGYMTLMAMFKAPDYFKAGVSGAPVTDWELYDTHYTERYMGHPDKDSEAYKNSSVFPYATNLKGPLLIYHGMADDNVLFKNSTKLYKLLQDNNIPFYVMDYPGKKHSIRGKKTGMHRINLIKNFFDLQFGLNR